MKRTPDIRKILVVRNDNLGDVLCTTPAIEALKRGVPGAWIGVLVADYTAPVLRGNPFVDSVYSYAKAKHGAGRLRSWADLVRVFSEIRAERFDAALAARSRLTPVLAGLVRFSGARVRIGFRPPPERRALGRWMTDLAEPPAQTLHEVERCMLLARGLYPGLEPGAMRLYLGEEEREEARRELSRRGLAGGVRPVCIHVSSRRKAGRQWPTDHYVDLLRNLIRDGVPVVLNAAPHERATGGEIVSRVGEPLREIGAEGVRRLAALFGECSVVVSLHGGGAHLAAASGARAVAIFNGGDPGSWAPWGKDHRVVASVPGDWEVRPDRVADAVIECFKL